MFFLSQILHNTVYDNHNDGVGRLVDVIVKPHEEYPHIIGIKLKTKQNYHFVPYSDIGNLGQNLVTLNIPQRRLRNLKPEPDDLLLAHDLLERQIVDINGAKLVRVNDIQLGKAREKLCVISLAVGNRSLLRRLGLQFISNLFTIKEKFIKWDDVNLVDTELSGKAKALHLKKIQSDLAQLHPADIANIIEELNIEQGKNIVEALDEETAGDVLEELAPTAKLNKLVASLEEEKAADILEEMEPDAAADVLGNLPEKKAQQLLELMEDEESEDIEDLLTYEKDSAGGMMNTDMVKIPYDYTITQTKAYIKKISPEFDSIYYIYVVDPDNRLKGVVSIRTVLITPGDTNIADLMQERMLTTHPDKIITEVAKKMTKYNLLSLAVVDHHKKLLGVVTVDDVLRYYVPEA